MRNFLTICSLSVLIFATTAVQAANSSGVGFFSPQLSIEDAPGMMSYQGILTDALGDPVADASYSVTFNIWDADVSGTSVWSEVQAVTTVDGLFSVILGSVNAIDDSHFSETNRWLGVQVDADPEMTPRTQLTSAPYAFRVATVDGATGGNVGYAKIGLFQGPSTTLSLTGPGSFAGGARLIFGDDQYEDDGNTNAFVGEYGWEDSTDSDMLQLHARRGIHMTVGTHAPQGPPVTTALFIEGAGFGQPHSGKVGIGTTTPTARLHVVGGPANFDNDLRSPTIGDATVEVLNNMDGLGTVDWVNSYYGVRSQTSSNDDGNLLALSGWAEHSAASAGLAYGLYGVAAGPSSINFGVYGQAFGGTTNYAGYFSGNVSVTGTLSKGAGSFKIDHPLEPDTKYLSHSFVESPDMMNIYNGNVILDANGSASVTMPEYFEALNRDFRYQLTSIGAPGPNLYVAQKIYGNTFSISGGVAGAEVSWQVTGVRQDAFANANRIPTVEEKPAHDIGKYMHPEAFGLDRSAYIVKEAKPMKKNTDAVNE